MASNDKDVSENKDLDSSTESSELERKRQCMTTPPPPASPSKSATGFTVPASPPRYVSMEEVMKAANAVSNMSLAHQIATDEEFQIAASEVNKNSLEFKVKEVMHKAFWDALRAKLDDAPPDYRFALNLLTEVKQNIFELLLPQHQRLKMHINEVLDMTLIEQQIDNETLNFKHYADFIISIMAKLCAPARDEQVAALQNICDIPDLFKEIFAVLEVLKMDMANFTIQQIRPFVQQQSVDYEKNKFAELLKQQEDNNLDGLVYTKAWLQRTSDRLCVDLETSSKEGLVAANSSSPLLSVTPSVIMNSSYVELLTWDENQMYPETMLLDRDRLAVMRDAIQRLTCVGSIMLVTYNIAGASLTSLTKFKTILKDKILIIIGDVPLSDLRSHMLNVSDVVLAETDTCLEEHGYKKLSDSQIEMLKDQIHHITDCDNSVRTLIQDRIINFFKALISISRPETIRFPAGVSSLSSELSKLGGHYLKLVSQNRAVFGSYYADIISTTLKTKEFHRGK